MKMIIRLIKKKKRKFIGKNDMYQENHRQKVDQHRKRE